MDSNHLLVPFALTLLLIYLIYKLIANKLSVIKLERKPLQAPKPKGKWPILGHLPLLAVPMQTFRTLGAMADECGPIFTIQLGSIRTVVVSGKEAIKECFTTNDNIFISRPATASVKHLGYNGASFSLGPYGQFWRQMRKITVLELLSDRRLSSLTHMRESEVDLGMQMLYNLCNSNIETSDTCQTVVDMSQWFRQVTINMILKMLVGKRYDLTVGHVESPNSESERFRNAFKKLALLTSGFDFSAVVPILGWLDFQGRVRSMKQTAEEVDYFMSTWLEEHIMEMQNGQILEQNFDFIHVMLSLFAEEDSIEGFDKKTVIKAAIQVFILAGSETPVISMIWALSLLLNHKEKLNRVQEELDMQVGREKWVQESDLKNLTYLIATVKETMRLYPSGPLSVPRESISDCHVSGYFVPKGTVLVTNLWKLHRDPNVWTNPDEFIPERFLMKNNAKIDGRGQHFEYLPFGTGKRMCPGVLPSLQIVHLVLARVLQGFNFATYMNEKVDMSEGMGIALSKAIPLEVSITPRLSRRYYQE